MMKVLDLQQRIEALKTEGDLKVETTILVDMILDYFIIPFRQRQSTRRVPRAPRPRQPRVHRVVRLGLLARLGRRIRKLIQKKFTNWIILFNSSLRTERA